MTSARTRYSVAMSLSFARPDASFIALRWSSEATKIRSPSTLAGLPADAFSLSYAGAPSGSLRMSRAPKGVSKMKCDPRSSVSASSWKGRVAGAPRRGAELSEGRGQALEVLLVARVRDVDVVARVGGAARHSRKPADQDEVDLLLD